METINIHLTVDEHTKAYCRSANEAIRRVVDGPIIFSDTSPMRPHVTVVVGQLQASAHVGDVVEEIRSEISDMPTLALTLLTPYLWPGTGAEDFVFVDIAMPDAVYNLRARLLERLEDGLMQIDHASLVVPHVTLAYVPIATDSLVRLLPSVAPTHVLMGAQVELSHSGIHGTCIDSIQVIPFAPKARGDQGDARQS